jgi:hypothetical protein
MSVDVSREPRACVMVTYFNKEVAVGGVIGNFRCALPQAPIHVFDDNSSDHTGALAATGHRMSPHSKGHGTRRMFDDAAIDSAACSGLSFRVGLILANASDPRQEMTMLCDLYQDVRQRG